MINAGSYDLQFKRNQMHFGVECLKFPDTMLSLKYIQIKGSRLSSSKLTSAVVGKVCFTDNSVDHVIFSNNGPIAFNH